MIFHNYKIKLEFVYIWSWQSDGEIRAVDLEEGREKGRDGGGGGEGGRRGDQVLGGC